MCQLLTRDERKKIRYQVIDRENVKSVRKWSYTYIYIYHVLNNFEAG